MATKSDTPKRRGRPPKNKPAAAAPEAAPKAAYRWIRPDPSPETLAIDMALLRLSRVSAALRTTTNSMDPSEDSARVIQMCCELIAGVQESIADCMETLKRT